ncbi:helix-turn-helix domain-containing protein [Methanocella sp. MCL-LM]|uniref:helix-turn-helix domain-containing protein n=1 Tax=Methanocella sp. MCL-LM TaxID=3412035 RepID=UPI003C741DF1
MRRLGKLTNKVYRRLCRDGPLTYHEIARRTHVKPATAYAAVQTLKRRGMVKVLRLLFVSERCRRGGRHVAKAVFSEVHR